MVLPTDPFVASASAEEEAPPSHPESTSPALIEATEVAAVSEPNWPSVQNAEPNTPEPRSPTRPPRGILRHPPSHQAGFNSLSTTPSLPTVDVLQHHHSLLGGCRPLEDLYHRHPLSLYALSGMEQFLLEELQTAADWSMQQDLGEAFHWITGRNEPSITSREEFMLRIIDEALRLVDEVDHGELSPRHRSDQVRKRRMDKSQ